MNPTTAKILLVDDQQANIELLELILKVQGFENYKSVLDSRDAIEVFHAFRPDLILLDLHMPHMTGFEVMEQLRGIVPKDEFLPILVLTADSTDKIKTRALTAGATDFLTKPFDPIEVILRSTNLLQTRFLHEQIRDQNRILEERVLQRTQELEAARIETLNRLAHAAEYRDDTTGRHAQRVGQVAAMLARLLGMSAAEIGIIRLAAPLHDIGKIGVSDVILLKPAMLDENEKEQMRKHTTVGADILSQSVVPLLKVAETIALTHHERWDGKGYPNKMAGEDIPLQGRIVAVADVYDALTHKRPYKPAWTKEKAVAEIEAEAGRQLDAAIAEVFLRAIHEGKEPELAAADDGGHD